MNVQSPSSWNLKSEFCILLHRYWVVQKKSNLKKGWRWDKVNQLRVSSEPKDLSKIKSINLFESYVILKKNLIEIDPLLVRTIGMAFSEMFVRHTKYTIFRAFVFPDFEPSEFLIIRIYVSSFGIPNKKLKWFLNQDLSRKYCAHYEK